MLRRITAIARLAMQAAIRSRLFGSLMFTLLITIVGIPMTIKGDGTLAGQMRLGLSYSLGFAALMLGIATLWSSCGAVAQEVNERQIQLLTTKPVRPCDIWLGKWVGLLALNGMLLALVGAVICGVVRWQSRAAATTPSERATVHEEVLASRRLVPARTSDTHAAAHERLEQMQALGQVPDGINPRDALEALERQIRAQGLTVAPGIEREWIFDMPARIPEDARIVVRFQFSGATRYRYVVSGTWSVNPGTSEAAFNHEISDLQGGPHEFVLPASCVQPGRPLALRFTNAPRDRSATAVFDFRRGIEILIREGTFETNLLRTLLIVWFHLALLAALGITAGSIFSFPVATFMSGSFITMANLIHYFTGSADHPTCQHAHHGAEQQASWFEELGKLIIEHVDVVVRPVMTLNPVDELAAGLLVSWTQTLVAAGYLLVLYPALIALLGVLVLQRRELALPSGSET